MTSAKFLAKWTTFYSQKVLKESHGLTQTGELEDLLHNAKATTELENGWGSDMSSILLLMYLMPPSPQGRNKRPGKLSSRHNIDHLVKFIKTGTIEGHLDSIAGSLQPYLLAVGTQKIAIHKYLIVIDMQSLMSLISNHGIHAGLDLLFRDWSLLGRPLSIATSGTREMVTDNGHCLTPCAL